MLIKTRGIVFRVVKFGETSVIADIYTEERGLQSYILNSVRVAKPKFSSALVQIMALVEMVAYAKEGKDLQHVKEMKAAYPFQSIPFEVMKGAVGTFMAELAQKTIKESESNPPLFHYLYQSFIFLDTTKESIANLHLCFALHLCTYLGFLPEQPQEAYPQYFDLREGIFCDMAPLHSDFLGLHEATILRHLLATSIEESHHLQLSTEERRSFLKSIIKYYELHTPNFTELRAISVLQTVLQA
jgi:DNA repair protein RecO (recombination protein O)